jgi:predicted DNA-binding protein (MmcQ/YjbR family)
VSRATGALQQAAKTLRDYALGLPGAYEEHPWGESVAKVNRKVFVFMHKGNGPLTELVFTVKLPESRQEALEFPWAEPTGYGLGKSGWVSVRFAQGEPPVDLFRCWIEESYRTIAPVKLVAMLDHPEPEPKPARKKPVTRKRKSK